MAELKFELGLVTYKLAGVNGETEVTFNPTDPAFLEKLFAAFDALEGKQQAFDADQSARSSFDRCRELDREMRTILDNALGGGVSEKLFGGMNVYAFAGGTPVWCNLLFAILDEVKSRMDAEQQAVNPRLEQYLAKYKR